MIDKTELLRMIMQTNPGKSPAWIMEQYALYLKEMEGISTNFSSADSSHQASGSVSNEHKEEQASKASITCGYVKRDLRVKPNVAITHDKIICCICGKEGQALTERHLNKHNGLTREGYIKLCGYPANQPLMSHKHLSRMKSNVFKAQEARKSKYRNRD